MFKKMRLLIVIIIGGIIYGNAVGKPLLGFVKEANSELARQLGQRFGLQEVQKEDKYGFDITVSDQIRVVNGDQPFFTDEEKDVLVQYEHYGSLDKLGRCTGCMALITKSMMPTEPREDIGAVKPTGWNQVNLKASGIKGYEDYKDIYLYNRCHLIGFQLTGQNANEKNLITGTRWMNLAMLPYENEVANVVENGGRVLYRVTPVFEGDNLLANGVLMEGFSLNDNGKSVCFCVFVPNIQRGITLDYKTGKMITTATH